MEINCRTSGGRENNSPAFREHREDYPEIQDKIDDLIRSGEITLNQNLAGAVLPEVVEA